MNPDSIKLTREQRRMALRPYREASDDHNLIGIIVHIFGIVDVLHAAGEDTPRKWGFRAGCSTPNLDYLYQVATCRMAGGCQDEDCTHGEYRGAGEWLHMLDAGSLGIAMLTYAGNVLCRLYRWYARAGRSW
jgi:hypothetical protein